MRRWFGLICLKKYDLQIIFKTLFEIVQNINVLKISRLLDDAVNVLGLFSIH